MASICSDSVQPFLIVSVYIPMSTVSKTA